jgi:hypothetical protein
MPIIQAAVPQAHLATAMGAPNRMLVEYSTEILLPVPGPFLITQILRHFVHALMDLNEFMVLADDARSYLASGGRFPLPDDQGQVVTPRPRDPTPYGLSIARAAREALLRQRNRLFGQPAAPPAPVPADATIPTRDSLLARLAAANSVVRQLYAANVLLRSPTLFSPPFTQANTFEARLTIVLGALLARHAAHVPPAITDTTRQLVNQAIEIVQSRYQVFRRDDFAGISAQTRDLLTQWLVTYSLQTAPPIPNPFYVDLSPLLGFTPGYLVREWAFSRRERMELVFGTPDLRGPLAADPVPPGGLLRREDYRSTSTELALLTEEERRATTQEALGITTGTLRRALGSVYYSGAGAVNQLASQASNNLLAEERRSVVLSLIQEFSESRLQTNLSLQAQSSSSTTEIRAPGVDPRLAATHHRFKVVVPVTATVEMYDVGLTWSPRIFNPFFLLRQAVRNSYREARDSHLMQYYVPEPVRPGIVFEQYTVTENVYLDSGDNDARVSKSFTIHLNITNRHDQPDFVNAVAEFHQDRGTWRNDSDQWTVGFEIDSYSGGTIRGRVFVEMEDEDNWQGYVYITIPVLRYSQDSVNALAAHEIAMRDYELKRQALEAQAHQYARIKQREFIERHERLTVLNRIVFDALIRRVCMPTLGPHVSYYKEIIARCIDWSHAKIEFEPARMDSLAFPDYPADHFVNSPGVRFFLPVIHVAENTLFDTLAACGTFQARASVVNAQNAIAAERARLQGNGPDQLDRFATEMVLGEHIEAVMSHHDQAR